MMKNKREKNRTGKTLVIVIYSILIFAGKFAKQDLNIGRDSRGDIQITVSHGHVHMDITR